MRRWTALSVLCLGTCLSGVTAAETLYDGSLNTLPQAQGWTFQALSPGSVTQSASGGATTFDTTALTTNRAGYGLPHALNRATGFRLDVDAELLSEFHAGSDNNADGLDDRAGFSVLAITSDLRGIELGFWTNRVWAQADSPLFTQAEGAAFNTTGAIRNYELTVLGNTYSLSAAGSPLLSGSLRDYSAQGFPYTVANSLFLGDDTSSANAAIRLARVELNAVPEPSGMLLAAFGFAGLIAWLASHPEARRCWSR